MSVRVSSWVWRESGEKGSALLLLLAIADNAHDDGTGAYPSVATLAHKTRLTPRAIQYLLRGLERRGALGVEWGTGPGGTNVYAVVMPSAGAKTLRPETGENPRRIKANRRTKGAQTGASGGEAAIAPEPSLEPSKEPSGNQPPPSPPLGADEGPPSAAVPSPERSPSPPWRSASHQARWDRIASRRPALPEVYRKAGLWLDGRDVALVFADVGKRGLARASPGSCDEALRRLVAEFGRPWGTLALLTAAEVAGLTGEEATG